MSKISIWVMRFYSIYFKKKNVNHHFTSLIQTITFGNIIIFVGTIRYQMYNRIAYGDCVLD